jgi:hypothetical protein
MHEEFTAVLLVACWYVALAFSRPPAVTAERERYSFYT